MDDDIQAASATSESSPNDREDEEDEDEDPGGGTLKALNSVPLLSSEPKTQSMTPKSPVPSTPSDTGSPVYSGAGEILPKTDLRRRVRLRPPRSVGFSAQARLRNQIPSIRRNHLQGQKARKDMGLSRRM